MKGDACSLPDGIVERTDLFGPVTAVKKDGKWLPIGRMRDRLVGLGFSTAFTLRAALLSAFRRTLRFAGRR